MENPTLAVRASAPLIHTRSTRARIDKDIQDLHAKCGIYTRSATVEWFLDQVGWTVDADLSKAKLLEPAAGDGAFLLKAAERLCRSYQQKGKRRTYKALAHRIQAYEIHLGEAAAARDHLVRFLVSEGLSVITATKLAECWVRTEDFLLAGFSNETFTHIVGNPPYVRWSRVPRRLQIKYRTSLPAHAAKGDLCLAFLDCSLRLLSENGRLGFLCSDRWLYARYAEEFRNTVLPGYVIERRASSGGKAFQARVDAYPIKLLMRRKKSSRRSTSRAMNGSTVRAARRIYEEWLAKYPTLEQAGCNIRVGPALSPERAFVGTLDELDVEEELLAPYLGPRELTSTGISWSKRYVICMHDQEGKLRDLSGYPRLNTHLARFRSSLEARAIVRNGAIWYRPIDRVRLTDWSHPKLLLPEMAKEPRVIIDADGHVPSHGVYAIFPPDGDIIRLHKVLADGILQTSLRAIAPRVKGGAFRCYKKFLARLPYICI